MSKDAAVRPNEGDLVFREAVCLSPIEEERPVGSGGDRDGGARPPLFPLPPRAMNKTSPYQSEVQSPGADLLYFLNPRGRCQGRCLQTAAGPADNPLKPGCLCVPLLTYKSPCSLFF